MTYEVYTKTIIPDSIIELMKTIDPVQYGDQTNQLNVNNLIEITKYLVEQGSLLLFKYKHTIIFLRANTPWLGYIDSVMSSEGNAVEYLKAFKLFLKWCETNTYYHKLQTRTSKQELLRLLKRIKGAQLEGTHPESFRTPEGLFVDEYTVGYILPTSLLTKENILCQ